MVTPARVTRMVRALTGTTVQALGLAAVAVSSLAVLAGCGGTEPTERSTTVPDSRTNPLPTVQERPIIFSAAGDITTITPDGSGQKALPATTEVETSPRWSPDGQRVAFVRDEGIYVMNADGADFERVTARHPGTEDPAWSPDGRRLAFSAESATGFALNVVNIDGTGLRELHAVENAYIGAPAFSPDGKQIAMSVDPSATGGQLDIWRMNSDGSGLRQVTRTTGDEGSAGWARDGKRLLFGAGGTGILTVNPDGSGLRKIMGDRLGADTLAALWAPDGERIAWTAKFEGGAGSEIFVMNADGSELKKITEPLATATSLDW